MLTIGIDDTDSERSLCTTYLAAVLMERLGAVGEVEDLPRLVRLNPCAPFKTRGNAAVAFALRSDRTEEVEEIALQTLIELSDLAGENTNPGLVVAETVTPEMRGFYRRAVTEILEIDEARKMLQEHGIWHRGFKKGRGLIGALAAVGSAFEDHTFELIHYRYRDRWGTPRSIDEPSVWRADSQTYPGTWDTVDMGSRRVVFSPHSPDPILFGIRGEDIGAIEMAASIIESEPAERRVLYITNQGTDSQMLPGEMGDLCDDRSYRLRGTVASNPCAIAGGHLFFDLASNGARLECAAFEPTKGFRDIVKRLMPGDLLEVYGAVRGGALNLEKMEVIALAERLEWNAPVCPTCKRRMKSAGKEQGYRCRRCRTSGERESRALPREIETGLYEVPPSARRHLTKPLIRYEGECVHPSR
ncbi:MAG: DUF1743 domain-containing protein [Methanotrichaceae archaeon]|nr:DUF1743 domain-containing protein [Methanotrichaceae archaeon]